MQWPLYSKRRGLGCRAFGFRVSVLMKYIDVGPPICPKDMVPMERKGKWELAE
jgi:hypothetical protein